MKRLCFGTVFTILSQALKPIFTVRETYQSIEKIVGMSVSDYEDQSVVTRRSTGEDEFPEEITSAFLESDSNDLLYGFNKFIISKIPENRKKCLALALIDVVRDDSTITDEVIVGLNSNYTKEKIIASNTFILTDLLVNVFIYAIKVSNKDCHNDVVEFRKNKNYLLSFEGKQGEITLYEDVVGTSTPLQSSIKKINFDSIFKEISTSGSLPFPNPSYLKFYQLSLTGKSFDLGLTSQFIKKNLSRYIFSREEYRKLTEDDADTVGIEALKKYNSTIDDSKRADNFGEVMIYSFLECVLNAPKILTNVETAGHSFLGNANSSSIHFLASPAINSDFQLVFGISDVSTDLEKGITSALKKVLNVIKNVSSERRLVSSAILNNAFDKKTTEYLKSILLPARTSKKYVDNAIGIFISYSLDIPEKTGLSTFDYRAKLEEKIENEVKSCMKSVVDEIQLLGLDSEYSFYIYILPMEDSPKEAKAIMDKAVKTSLGGDD